MMPTRRSAYVGFRVDVRLRRGVPPGSDFLGGLLTVMLEGCGGGCRASCGELATRGTLYEQGLVLKVMVVSKRGLTG